MSLTRMWRDLVVMILFGTGISILMPEVVWWKLWMFSVCAGWAVNIAVSLR